MTEHTPHSELHERVALCRQQLAESPYSHTIAAGWYAEDVPRLLEQLEVAWAVNECQKCGALHPFAYWQGRKVSNQDDVPASGQEVT